MNNNFVSKVFQWLAIGLFVTFGCGYVLTLNEDVIVAVANSYLFIAIAEIVLAIVLSVRIHKMKDSTAKILYLLYAALTGATFMAVFLVYGLTSILWVFLITAIIFGVFGLIGKNIKIKLNGFGTFLLIALTSMILLSIVNMFLLNEALDLTVCLVSILIFCGYIAFDINKIMRMKDMQLDEKYAVISAFELYLDIINIILDLLRLLNRNND